MLKCVVALALVACTNGSDVEPDIESGIEPDRACEYVPAADVPSCSVLDVRGGAVLRITGALDPSALGEGFVRALDVVRDPSTGDPGARYERADGTCGFTPCVFEYRDLSTALAHCGDPPLIPPTDSVVVENEIVTMTESDWSAVVMFEDAYAQWARCSLLAVQSW